MDASSKIQGSIHDVRLTYKYVSRILGTYQSIADFLIFSQKKRLLKMDRYLKISILYDIFCCIKTGCLYMVYTLMKRKIYER